MDISQAESLRQTLKKGIEELHLTLDAPTLDGLLSYILEFQRWNKTHNLSAIHSLEESIALHLLDSLAVLPYLDDYAQENFSGEQLSAMEMMAVDPLTRVVAPRLWAGIIAMPVLATIFSAVGIMGGYLVGVPLIGVDDGAFWSQMQAGVDVMKDIGNGVVKSMVFGVAVTFIALYQGYEAKPTPEGVARATTRTVVIASLAVLALDFLLTAVMFSN